MLNPLKFYSITRVHIPLTAFREALYPIIWIFFIVLFVMNLLEFT